jgi:hypothetical protein
LKHSFNGSFDPCSAKQQTAAVIEQAVKQAVDEAWAGEPMPWSISELDHHGDGTDWVELTFSVDLGCDLVLPFEMPDADVLTLMHGGAAGYAAYVVDTCLEVMSHTSQLGAARDVMLAKAEAYSRALAEQGLHLPVAMVSLAPHESWLDPAEVRFQIALDGLGDHLRAAKVLGESAGVGDDLARCFEWALDRQRLLVQARADARAAGADGKVDAIALAAIRMQPEPLALFHAMATGEMVELPDGVSLHWSNGRLRSQAELPGAEWFNSRLELNGRWFSAPASARLKGQPASAVLDHPALVQVIIRKSDSWIEDGRRGTTLELDVPLHHFEAATGRTWPVVDPGADRPSG